MIRPVRRDTSSPENNSRIFTVSGLSVSAARAPCYPLNKEKKTVKTIHAGRCSIERGNNGGLSHMFIRTLVNLLPSEKINILGS